MESLTPYRFGIEISAHITSFVSILYIDGFNQAGKLALALANASKNLAGRVENRPGRVEFCISYIRECPVRASAKKFWFPSLLMQERHNSSSLAMELCLSCTNRMLWRLNIWKMYRKTAPLWSVAPLGIEQCRADNCVFDFPASVAVFCQHIHIPRNQNKQMMLPGTPCICWSSVLALQVYSGKRMISIA